MKSVDRTFSATYEIKKSKFIAYITPISNFKLLRDKLKIEHPKARHIVYAYRELNEFNQIIENSSDDGEPKGSSGVPVLNVLRGEEFINVAILVVRYFGGIKLGIGGLVRAYTASAKLVIETSDSFLYENIIEYNFKSTYKNIQRVEYILRETKIDNFNRDFLSDGVEWTIKAPVSKIEEFKEKI
jgi:uncharacterized YigZ family protein